MRQIMVVLAVVAMLVSACGRSPVSSTNNPTDFAISNSASAQPVQTATKPIVRLAETLPHFIRVEPVGPGDVAGDRIYQKSIRAAKPTISYGVVNVIVTTNDGRQAFGGPEYFLDFVQDIPNWIGTNFGADGEVSLSLAKGYYRARLVYYFTNEQGQFMGTIGEWSSIPIRKNQVNTVVLTIGRQAAVSYSIPDYSVLSLVPSTEDLKGPMNEGIAWDYFRVNLAIPSSQDILVESVQILNLTPQASFDITNLGGIIRVDDGQYISLIGIGYSSNAWLCRPTNSNLIRVRKGSAAFIAVGGVPLGSGKVNLGIRVRYYYANDPFAGEPDGQIRTIDGPVKTITILPRQGEAELIVVISQTPMVGNLEAGTKDNILTWITFDGTALHEDVFVSHVKAQLHINTPGTADDLRNGRMFDDTNTALTVGSTVINPANTMKDGDLADFALALTFKVVKSTVRNAVIKFDMAAQPVGVPGVSTYGWGLANDPETITAYGATSGHRIPVRIIPGNGQPFVLR